MTERPVPIVLPERAKAILVERFGRGVSDIAAVGHGEWSTAYAFRRDEREYIARFSATGEDFRKDRLAERYASADLPIPRIVELGEVHGVYYAISEQVRGGVLDELDERGMRDTLPALLAALDAARDADLGGTTGYGLWGADGHAPHRTWRSALLDVATDTPARRIHGWRERMARSPGGCGPFDEAYRALEMFVEHVPEERHLIHSDLLHYNVLADDGRITAVLDWGSSMYGDFLYDIAWLCFWAPWYPAWKGIDFRREALRHYESIGLDVPSFDERLRCYQVHIGLDGQAYSAWRGNHDDLAATAQRTLDVARGAAQGVE